MCKSKATKPQDNIDISSKEMYQTLIDDEIPANYPQN